MSVKDMTPVKCPDKDAPGNAEAEMEGTGAVGGDDDIRLEAVREEWFEGAQRIADVFAGVEGPEEAGEEASTIHIL